MDEGPRSPDPALHDRRWVGYHPRATAPIVALVSVLSLVLWTGRWYFDEISALADRLGGLALFALSWGVWPALGAIWLYRAVTYTYRLTDRALLVDFGFLARPVPPIQLTDITAVVAGGAGLGRLLGVGWVEVRTADRVVRLPGVRRPEEFASAVLAEARARSV